MIMRVANLSTILGHFSPRWRTLGQWLVVYDGLLTERGYNPQTLKNRRGTLKHVLALWGDVRMGALLPHMISAALKPYFPARATLARRILGELRGVLQEAANNGWCETNPASHVKLPPHQRLTRKRLPEATWHQMRAHARGQSRIKWLEPLLLLALVTGQRRADLAKARFDDVIDGHLRIEQQKKAGKPIGARVAIPLTLKLHAIDMTLADVIELCRTHSKPGPTLLRVRGGGDIEVSSLSMRFNECIRAVCGPNAYKVNEWPSLHECRSLAARLYAGQGEDVQTLLGHKNAEMTAVYKDDRGLSAAEWKHLKLVPSQPHDAAEALCTAALSAA